MAAELIRVEAASKKFSRSLGHSWLIGMSNLVRKLLRQPPRAKLGKGEFWALQDVSFSVRQGECLGVIGPNGAGKSTLLKLIDRDYRPDAGRIATLGAIKSLIRIGTGLQPLLSGRENIYIQCSQLGLSKRETDEKLDEIIAFAELQQAIDAPVKSYSDGMYARLEFAIATCVQMDILLIDEVLAVGDIAFQMRALDRINRLKAGGAAIVFVSHSEMNVRHVADRCLLLFDGRQLALGAPDALFYKYYESVGYLNKQLRPLGAVFPQPPDFAAGVSIRSLERIDSSTVGIGSDIKWILDIDAAVDIESARATLQFWNAAKLLVAAAESGELRLARGNNQIRVQIPFLGLTAGIYRLAVAIDDPERPCAYAGDLVELVVVDSGMSRYRGLVVQDARFDVQR